ncbi:unnamed protein product, partial [Brassica rapa subsp. narinosa]
FFVVVRILLRNSTFFFEKVEISVLSNSSIAEMATPNPFPAGISKEQAFSMAQTEMEYRVELFNKLAQTCFSKCVDKSSTPLSKANTDFFLVLYIIQVNGMVGQLLSAGKPPM